MIAAMAGVLAAFCVAAGIDWMWELSIVGLVAVVALGVLVGRATAPEADPRPGPARPPGAHARLRARALRTAGVAVAFGAILCVAVPMLAQSRLEESQAAAARATRRRRSTPPTRRARSSRGRRRPTCSLRCSRSRRGTSPRRTATSTRRSSATTRTGASGWSRRDSRRRPVLSQRAPEPAAGRAAESQVAALRGAPGSVQVLPQLRVKPAHPRRAWRLALLAVATLPALLGAAAAGRGRAPARDRAAGLRLHRHPLRPCARRRRPHGEARLPVARGSRRPIARPTSTRGSRGPALRLEPVRRAGPAGCRAGPRAAHHHRAGAAVGGARHGRPARHAHPDPAEFAAFGSAIAQRYSGTYAACRGCACSRRGTSPTRASSCLRRTRTAQPYSPHLYRAMVNAFSAAVHSVHKDNVVVAGAQFPFVIDRPGGTSIGPYASCATCCASPRTSARCRTAARRWRPTCGATTPTPPAAPRTARPTATRSRSATCAR